MRRRACAINYHGDFGPPQPLKGTPAQGTFLRLLGQLHNPISQEDLPASLEGHPDLAILIEKLEKGRYIERHRALAVVASRSGLRTSVACRILKQCRSSYVRSVRRFEDGGAERLFAPRINPHRSVELERLTAEGITLIERRNCLEVFRDQAIERFETHTGSSWRPRSGQLVNHRMLTAALIDSRDFIAAKRRAETEVMLPPGPKIALTGGLDFNDHHLIWDRLDKVYAKHPDMVLLHGGSPKGAELIASKWAINRKVPQIAFKPGWTKHAKAAPFQRNDVMLELLPIGAMHFTGTGIQDNLADKAKRLGISVWKFGKGDA